MEIKLENGENIVYRAKISRSIIMFSITVILIIVFIIGTIILFSRSFEGDSYFTYLPHEFNPDTFFGGIFILYLILMAVFGLFYSISPVSAVMRQAYFVITDRRIISDVKGKKIDLPTNMIQIVTIQRNAITGLKSLNIAASGMMYKIENLVEPEKIMDVINSIVHKNGSDKT